MQTRKLGKSGLEVSVHGLAKSTFRGARLNQGLLGLSEE